MRLFALSDLHLGHEVNRRALSSIRNRPDDWLIRADDVGEKRAHLRFAFETLGPRFRQLVWVPGNHELWTIPSIGDETRGQCRYEELIELCRSYHVLTPEDPYPVVSLGRIEVRIAPLFLLYDYSFRPSDVALEQAVEWAGETGVVCTDELLLHADPYPGIVEWCHARCDLTELRLARQGAALPTVLINHFPCAKASCSCRAFRDSPSGGGLAEPKIGIFVSMPPLPYRGACISDRHNTATACGSRRFRSGTPTNGAVRPMIIFAR